MQRGDWTRTVILGAMFLLSGATSLVYQVLWVRQLSLLLGSTLYAISAVVAAFMAGLALGSAVLGDRADRFRSPLLLYACLEAGIGVIALVLPFVFRLLSQASIASTWIVFVASFLLLLLPTALMGGTLPALARYVAGFPGSRGRLIGGLYALNTAGAVLGAALAGFWSIRALGIEMTTRLVALGNFAIFGVGAVLSRLAPGSAPAAQVAPRDQSQREVSLLGPVTVAYVTNGFAGLGLEVLWTRAVLLFTGNSIYAFTIILTTFLFGIAVGSTLLAASLRRVRDAPRLFAAFQCLTGLVVGVTPVCLAAIGVPIFESVQQKSLPMGLAAQALGGYVTSILFILPATLLMGACFPLVARIVADHTSRVGHALGRIYALNTLGAVLGSLLASLVLLPALGIERSILLAAMLCTATGVYLARRAGVASWTRLGAVIVAAQLVLLVAAPARFRVMLEKMLHERLTFYEEGLETTVGAYTSRKVQRPVLLINNVALDDHGVVHKMLAHLPALFHPAPRRGLVLGFGVGISSNSLAAYALPVNDCVEISSEVMNAAPEFASLNGNIAARGDASFRVHIADGRRFLMANREPYDLIALDANSGKLRNAGVGKLYTREFFELCRQRLAPDGLITAYLSPNGTLREFRMIVATFAAAFPHTTLWIDPVYGETCVLLGSNQPLRIDVERYLERLARPAVRADLAVFDLDQPGALLGAFLMGEEKVQLFAAGAEINTDDHPIMEFYALDMDPFEVDDHPLSEAGLPLYAESVRPLLDLRDADSPGARAVLDFVAAEERAAPLVQRSLEATRSGQPSEAVEWWRAAATVHPEAESLRSLLGYGRSAARRAGEALGAERSAHNLAAAGILAARRGDGRDALPLLEAAVATGANDARSLGGIEPADVHLEAARSALATGDAGACRVHLDAAQGLGADVRLDRAELALHESKNPAEVEAILGTVRFRTSELGRVFRIAHELEQRGAGDRNTKALEAGALEALGDPAGAWLAYRSLQDGSEDVRTRLEICALQLGLRQSVERRAYGPGVEARSTLESRFGAGTVPATAVPDVDDRRAAPWLELAALQRRAGRGRPAYQLARTARTLEPRNPVTYLAVAQSALAIRGDVMARLALERAIDLDPGNKVAAASLQKLQGR